MNRLEDIFKLNNYQIAAKGMIFSPGGRWQGSGPCWHRSGYGSSGPGGHRS